MVHGTCVMVQAANKFVYAMQHYGKADHEVSSRFATFIPSCILLFSKLARCKYTHALSEALTFYAPLLVQVIVEQAMKGQQGTSSDIQEPPLEVRHP